MILTLFLACFCVTSLGLNAFLLYKSKKQPVQRKESLELEEFLHDLLAGNALVRVTRISPVDVLLRSPRTK